MQIFWINLLYPKPGVGNSAAQEEIGTNKGENKSVTESKPVTYADPSKWTHYFCTCIPKCKEAHDMFIISAVRTLNILLKYISMLLCYLCLVSQDVSFLQYFNQDDVHLACFSHLHKCTSLSADRAQPQLFDLQQNKPF